MKTVGIVGSRRRNSVKDADALHKAFKKVYEEGDRIVSGGCEKGGDAFAEELARMMGLTITIHHADWNGMGKSAGFVRNTKIAEDCDVLIALMLLGSHGTGDTITKARDLHKKVILV